MVSGKVATPGGNGGIGGSEPDFGRPGVMVRGEPGHLVGFAGPAGVEQSADCFDIPGRGKRLGPYDRRDVPGSVATARMICECRLGQRHGRCCDHPATQGMNGTGVPLIVAGHLSVSTMDSWFGRIMRRVNRTRKAAALQPAGITRKRPGVPTRRFALTVFLGGQPAANRRASFSVTNSGGSLNTMVPVKPPPAS